MYIIDYLKLKNIVIYFEIIIFSHSLVLTMKFRVFYRLVDMIRYDRIYSNTFVDKESVHSVQDPVYVVIYRLNI